MEGANKQLMSVGATALVKHAGAVEALGACSVLCLDGGAGGPLLGELEVQSVCLLPSSPPDPSEAPPLPAASQSGGRGSATAVLRHQHQVPKRKSDGLSGFASSRLLKQAQRRSAPPQQQLRELPVVSRVSDRLVPGALVLRSCASGAVPDHLRLLVDAGVLAASARGTGGAEDEMREGALQR
jgi:hypothetical protein